MKILFLASHGLRTHLSALRWASSRLRRSPNLAKEQRHLADELYEHTRILTTGINAMLLIGRLEEKEIVLKPEPLELLPLLQGLEQTQEGRDTAWRFSCPPSARVRAARPLLEQLLACLQVLCQEATVEPHAIFVNVLEQSQVVTVHIYARWELPLLLPAQSTAAAPLSGQAVGGTPGLMLAMASEIAGFLQGSAELEEIPAEDDDLVTDGTVERTEGQHAGEFRITVVLPKA